MLDSYAKANATINTGGVIEVEGAAVEAICKDVIRRIEKYREIRKEKAIERAYDSLVERATFLFWGPKETVKNKLRLEAEKYFQDYQYKEDFHRFDDELTIARNVLLLLTGQRTINLPLTIYTKLLKA